MNCQHRLSSVSSPPNGPSPSLNPTHAMDADGRVPEVSVPILKTFVEKVVRDSITHAKQAKESSVAVVDVVHALKCRIEDPEFLELTLTLTQTSTSKVSSDGSGSTPFIWPGTAESLLQDPVPDVEVPSVTNFSGIDH
ncbi:hypothetical protein B0H13DRAFT_2301242 [Mycena leptocephala]|nr:hypothetical protein B0H13DRAFT_2301242 [Mycena leptocephala]